AGIDALFFGIHPMRVESVAWVTERKDVLYGAFYFAAIFTYLKYLFSNKKRTGYLVVTLVLFGLSLLSKIQAVALPLSLLAIDYWLKRDLNFQRIIEKLPFFLGSLIVGLVGIFFLSQEGSLEQATDYTFGERLLVGGYSYVIYLLKFVFPYEMSPLYPYPSTIGTNFYLGTALLLPIVVGLFYAHKKGYRVLLFGFAFFTFNVMFMLQILGAGQAFIADRFTYVPYFGLFFIIGYYFQQIPSHKATLQKAATIGLGAYLLIFGVMTWQQNKIWKNGETLWTHVLKYYQNIDTPYSNRAQFYRDQGNVQLAIADYTKAIEVQPDKGNTYNSRGKTYFDLGTAQNDQNLVQKAIADYTKGIEMSPELGELYANRGAAFGYQGKMQEALIDLNQAVALEPDKIGGYANRSLLHMQLGNHELAIQDHTAYLQLNPYDAEVWYERGVAKSNLGQHQAAIEDYNRALTLDHQRGIFFMQRALAYKNVGNKTQAVADLRTAQQFGAAVPAAYWKGLQ
ncbi:MAG: tetratricopeptide repeat protein, partial [Bacteroidota bacterium]